MKNKFHTDSHSLCYTNGCKFFQLIGLVAWLGGGGLGVESVDAQRRGAAQPRLPGIVSNVVWAETGDHVEYSAAGKRYRFDLHALEKMEIDEIQQSPPTTEPDSNRRPAQRRSGDEPAASTGRYLDRPTRGRQHTQVESPDGQWLAEYKDWNLVLTNRQTEETIAVTTDGDELVHFGTASWVYGEELGQKQAMWWTPDSQKILYYKFDDRQVKPFYLLRGWSEINTELFPEYYPKAGAANPIAELFIYDLESKQSQRIDIGGSGEEYIYGIRVTPAGDAMLVNWTDRLQQHLKVFKIDLETGKCELLVEEQQPTWQTNSPSMTYLKDRQRFLWPSDRTGFTHYELRDLDGNRLHQVTNGDYQVNSIELMEEDHLLGFVANSSAKNPYFAQYHLVELDGQHQRRVTALDYHHSGFELSPDRKWLIAQYEDVNRPPCTALYRTDGTFVANLAETEITTAANLAETFHFQSADGKFDIHGILYKPANFDSQRQYPIINALYGGPNSTEYRPTYVATPRPECRQGYLVVKVNNRGTSGRGKVFLSSTYRRLGDVDIQDHADAIRHLASRPYIDSQRVGIVGHSYGGYMAAMGILRHPDVYTASVVRAGVTDWQNYDTIYTERYMSTPQLNPEGYKQGAAMTLVDQFQGQMLIMHGMLDDNVHPNNAFQLIEALDKAGKKYESRFWANAGHGLAAGANETQAEFFRRTLRPDQVIPASVTEQN